MENLVEITNRDVEEFAKRGLTHISAAMHQARRAVANNMAFGVREECIIYGIPKVMEVRNPNILRASLSVVKATRNHEVATLGQSPRARFSGLAEEEFGGGLMKRHPATKAARGTDSATLPGKFRFKGDFLSPEDIDVAHDTGSNLQRLVVMISQLERKNYTKPFIMRGGMGIAPGLVKLGKKISRPRVILSRSARKPAQSRQIVTLRPFTKDKTHVRKIPWMRPSIDHWLATHNASTEFAKALDHIATMKQRRGWTQGPA